MKTFVLLTLLIITVSPAIAQTNFLEELPLPTLKRKLAESNSDTARIKLQIAIGRLVLIRPGGGNHEGDSVMKIAEQAIKLSRQIKFDEGTINAMLLSALCYNKKNETKTGLKIARQAFAFSEKIKYKIGIAESFIVIGQHYSISDPAELVKRMYYYKKASTIFREQRNFYRLSSSLQGDAEMLLLNRQHMEAIAVLFEAINVTKTVEGKSVHGIYWLIGRTLDELGNFPNALKYTLLAIKSAKEAKDTSLTVCSINYTMAAIYISMKDYKRAMPYVLNALRIAEHYRDPGYIYTVTLTAAYNYTRLNQLNQALAVLKKTALYASDDADTMLLMVSYLGNLTYAKKYKEAAFYAREVRNFLAKIPPDNFNNRMTAYNYLAFHYIETRQIKLAYFYADKYAAIVNSINFPIGVRSVENFYYKLDSMQGNFESALKHRLLAQRVKDSIDNVSKAYQISLLHIENETEKKNRDIDTLTKQAQIKDGALKRNQLIQKTIMSGAFLLTVITGLIFSRYRLKQKTNFKLEENQRELDQKNTYLEAMNTEQEKLIKKKEWLIKEVHHRVKNNLQMVTSLLSSQSAYLNDDAAIVAVNDSLRRMQAMSMIHQKLYQDENVATIAMQEYADELICYLRDSFDDDNRIVFIQKIEPLNLDISQAIPLGLIITESIVNAIKYAFLNNQKGIVTISLKNDGPEHLLLSIADNGIGLPEGMDKLARNSLGLDLMQGLSQQLKGSFNIENKKGVHITVRFGVRVKQAHQLYDK